MHYYKHAEVAVLGAGIMGCCLALELAQRGQRVDLIDLAPTPMTGASLHNEGKLHMGFVYAKDPLKKTYSLMLRGSLSFSKIIERLTGHGTEHFQLSQPFHYFVPDDSQLNMDAIESHFQQIETAIHDITANSDVLYLNQKSERYYSRNTAHDHEALFSPDSTLGSFKTEERSVSPIAIASILSHAVEQHAGINFIANTSVLAANRLASGDVEIVSKCNDRTVLSRYACVANCLWDGKFKIDQTAGITDRGQWISRYKATINISACTTKHNNIPSATGILGAYGDVVNYHDGSYYISWYPECKLAQSVNEDGRKLHDVVRKRSLSSEFVHRNIKEMATYVPAMSSLLDSNKRYEIGGGVILARGATDIDDPDSNLHQRWALLNE
ncbi:MAG: FAD-dependent oxidoreductase [Chloroflexota bacterium]